MRDYRAQPELDVYERRGIDADYQEEMDGAERLAARRAAEEELDDRDEDELALGLRRGVRRLPGALADLDAPARRRRRIERAQAGVVDEEEDAPEIRIKLEQVRGPLREWVVQAPVSDEVARRFKKFLRSFDPDGTGEHRYRRALEEAVRRNRMSVDLSFRDLATVEPTLALWLVSAPRQVLDIFHEAAYEVTRELYPHLKQIIQGVFVRVTNVPGSDCIRDLRQTHLDELVKVSGVVTRRTGVFPQLQLVHYDCLRCGYRLGPVLQNQDAEQAARPQVCPNCQNKGPFQVNQQQTVYRNYQKLTLQESPGTVPAGRLPRSKEVVLLNDLIDVARPGEEIEVTGILTHQFSRSLNAQAGFPVFPTMIEANGVTKREDKFSAGRLTDEDRQAILALAREGNIAQRLVKSVAPSIHGHANIKEALCLAMFGGQRKADGNHRLRGDINVLLLGDPGVAKSQFLKYVEKAAQRAVFTTGKGASAVGLTAAVHKDPTTKEWVLEGGALVLADRGVCLIDEFDKMGDQDRVSIHEAMEQQSISISKAGIVTQLQARCSVIAAANPEGGRYDSSRTFAENVNLSEPILSRFDVLCVIRDTADRLRDEQLAEFVIDSHCRSHPLLSNSAEQEAALQERDPDILSQEMLRKYVTYAKQTCRPKLDSSGYEKLSHVYSQLRHESMLTQGMPIAVRHLESMIRIAEAHALMHLRDSVESVDVDAAIRVMLTSFLSTQKFAVQQQLRRKFRAFLREPGEFRDLLMHLLERCFKEAQVSGAGAARGGGLAAREARGSPSPPWTWHPRPPRGRPRGPPPLAHPPQRHMDIYGPLRNQRRDELCVPIADFEEQARAYQLRSPEDVFSSPAFRARGFSLDRDRGFICLRVAVADDHGVA